MSDSGGLYLEVLKGGTKTWRALVTDSSKKRIRVSFGAYPDVSLADAREALALRKSAAKAARANGGSSVSSDAGSFSAVLTLWKETWSAGKARGTIEKVESNIGHNILPVLGARNFRSLRAPDYVKFVVDIEKRGSPESARQALDICRQIARFAVVRGFLDTSPIADIKPKDVFKDVKVKNFARLRLDEMTEFFSRLDLYSGRPVTKLAVNFLALTMLRTQEVRLLRWECVAAD